MFTCIPDIHNYDSSFFSPFLIILKVFRKIELKNTVVECPSSLYANVTFISEVKDVVSVVGLGVYNGGNQTVLQSVIRLKIVAVYVRGMAFTVSVWPINLQKKVIKYDNCTDKPETTISFWLILPSCSFQNDQALIQNIFSPE